MKRMELLYRQGGTIVTTNDLRVLWQEGNPDALKARVQYCRNTGRLLPLRRGIYALTADYDRFELAQKLVVPSYISLETALQAGGVIFQHTGAITSCARYSRTIVLAGQQYRYHKLQDAVLLDPSGIRQHAHYAIASPERAVCDWIYLKRSPSFDRLDHLDPALLRRLAALYDAPYVTHAVASLLKSP